MIGEQKASVRLAATARPDIVPVGQTPVVEVGEPLKAIG